MIVECDIIFENAIDNLKAAKLNCVEIEAYEIACSLLNIAPDGVSQSRLQNVDFELSST